MSITSDLVASFKRATRLAFLRKTPQFPPETSTGALIILVFLNILTSIYFEYMDAGENLYFNSLGLNAHFASFVVLFILIFLMGTKSSLPSPQRVIADITSLGVWFFVLHISLHYAYPLLNEWLGLDLFTREIVQGVVNTVLFVWAIAALWWTGRSLWHGRLRLPGLRLVAIVVAPMFLVPHQAVFTGSTTDWTRYDIWYWGEKARYALFPQTASNKKRPKRIDVEAAYYRQPALIEKGPQKTKTLIRNDSQILFCGSCAR